MYTKCSAQLLVEIPQRKAHALHQPLSSRPHVIALTLSSGPGTATPQAEGPGSRQPQPSGKDAEATDKRVTLRAGTWSAWPRQGTGLLALTGLRLRNSSQNPYSLSESHREPGVLHICSLILNYLASSPTSSSSY